LSTQAPSHSCRVGHAVVVAQLGWAEAKPEHVAKVQAIVREIVDGVAL